MGEQRRAAAIPSPAKAADPPQAASFVPSRSNNSGDGRSASAIRLTATLHRRHQHEDDDVAVASIQPHLECLEIVQSPLPNLASKREASR